MNRFHIKTLGCKVNQYESQVIRENFVKNGYVEARNADEADICVVNTCTVTSASDSKSLKSIRSGFKKKNKCIIATGCMIDAEDLDLSKLKGVDFIIKNRDKYNIPYIIRGPHTTRVRGRQGTPYHKGTGQAGYPIPEGYGAGKGQGGGGITSFKGHARAFVKVQDGCNNRCSYCKVSVV